LTAPRPGERLWSRVTSLLALGVSCVLLLLSAVGVRACFIIAEQEAWVAFLLMVSVAGGVCSMTLVSILCIMPAGRRLACAVVQRLRRHS